MNWRHGTWKSARRDRSEITCAYMRATRGLSASAWSFPRIVTLMVERRALRPLIARLRLIPYCDHDP
jgi:hypothetical protein